MYNATLLMIAISFLLPFVGTGSRRFTAPVTPGEEIVTQMWRDASTSDVIFRSAVGDRQVVLGRVLLRDSPTARL